MGKKGPLLIWLKRWKEVQFRAGRKIETKQDIGEKVFTLTSRTEFGNQMRSSALWFY